MEDNPARQPGAHDGQGLVEYSLILITVALVVIAAMVALGPTLQAAYQKGVAAFP